MKTNYEITPSVLIYDAVSNELSNRALIPGEVSSWREIEGAHELVWGVYERENECANHICDCPTMELAEKIKRALQCI